MDQEKIGKFIKKIRQREKLSQREFAEKYGVTYQAVSKWETGKNIPDIAILKQMCQEYHINLNNLLDTKLSIENKRYGIPILLFFLILFIAIFFLFIYEKKENQFEFKTLETTCDNFNLYGSIAYNNRNSSIYISNITYCGSETLEEFKTIECRLYEKNNKTQVEISKIVYDKEESISLEKFLKDVEFKIDHYETNCKNFSKNSLHMEIEATTLEKKIIAYKIPLRLEDTCKHSST